eukprot:434284_1
MSNIIKPSTQPSNDSIKQETKQTTTHSHNSNVNIHQMCFCKKQLKKSDAKSGGCLSCCQLYSPNETQFFWCDQQCDYAKISAEEYIICSKCFNRRYNGINDIKTDFISIKTKANIKIMSEEMNALNDIQQRKKYMSGIYSYLYRRWIVKLNNDELTKDFNDFYSKQL